MTRNFLGLVLSVLLLLGGMPLDVQAAPPAPPRPPPPRGVVTLPDTVLHQARQAPRSQQVQVSMMVVHATDAHSRVDPRLGNLTQYFSHMRFTGYDLLGTSSATLSANDSETFSIQGGREVTITLLSQDDQRVRMRVQMTAGRESKLLDTTLSVNRNGTFIVAGPKYESGILVLPLTARY